MGCTIDTLRERLGLDGIPVQVITETVSHTR